MSLKKFSLFSLSVVAGLSILVAGCSKTSADNNIPVGMTALVGGKSFLAYQASATSFPNYYAVHGIGNVGGDTISLTVYISLPDTLNQKVSTDNNSTAEVDDVIFQGTAQYAVYSASNGNGHAFYTVTALDTIKHTIAGTFSGTLPINNSVGSLPDSIVISNGEFNVTYQ